MYAADVADRRLTFAVSGKLWKHSLIMIDQQTGSLWSHLLGKCMEGELEGERLERIPSTMTDWTSWSEAYPTTSVLEMPETTTDYGIDYYGNYGNQEFLVALASGQFARGWRFDRLTLQPVVNDTFDDSPILVWFDPYSKAANIFERQLDQRVLEFELRDEQLIDRTTGSVWNPMTGEAVAGELAGAQLKRLPGIISFSRAWDAFHPHSTYWEPNSDR